MVVSNSSRQGALREFAGGIALVLGTTELIGSFGALTSVLVLLAGATGHLMRPKWLSGKVGWGGILVACLFGVISIRTGGLDIRPLLGAVLAVVGLTIQLLNPRLAPVLQRVALGSGSSRLGFFLVNALLAYGVLLHHAKLVLVGVAILVGTLLTAMAERGKGGE